MSAERLNMTNQSTVSFSTICENMLGSRPKAQNSTCFFRRRRFAVKFSCHINDLGHQFRIRDCKSISVVLNIILEAGPAMATQF